MEKLKFLNFIVSLNNFLSYIVFSFSGATAL